MKKKRFTLSFDSKTASLIDEAARLNDTSRSAIANMLLQMIRYVPVDNLRETSPIPSLLGISKKEANHAD